MNSRLTTYKYAGVIHNGNAILWDDDPRCEALAIERSASGLGSFVILKNETGSRYFFNGIELAEKQQASMICHGFITASILHQGRTAEIWVPDYELYEFVRDHSEIAAEIATEPPHLIFSGQLPEIIHDLDNIRAGTRLIAASGGFDDLYRTVVELNSMGVGYIDLYLDK